MVYPKPRQFPYFKIELMYLIIDTAKIPKNPSTAHTRLAIELSKALPADLISTREEIERLDIDNYKYFIVMGSAFYPETASIEAVLRKNKNAVIVWVNNEYGCSPNSEYAALIKDHQSIVLSNVVQESNKVKWYDKFYLLNLNCLLFDSLPRQLDKKYELIYYGTYRPNRRVYLQKYFQNPDFYISSSKKNLRKFKFLNGCKAIWCDKLNWQQGKETLNLFRYSLYIEDQYTHVHYNHLANRFYECLMCNVVQFFDVNCANTITKSGYNMDKKFIVSGYEELQEKTKKYDFQELLKEQQIWKAQANQEKTKVTQHIKEILNVR